MDKERAIVLEGIRSKADFVSGFVKNIYFSEYKDSTALFPNKIIETVKKDKNVASFYIYENSFNYISEKGNQNILDIKYLLNIIVNTQWRTEQYREGDYYIHITMPLRFTGGRRFILLISLSDEFINLKINEINSMQIIIISFFALFLFIIVLLFSGIILKPLGLLAEKAIVVSKGALPLSQFEILKDDFISGAANSEAILEKFNNDIIMLSKE
jgi:hypothetical protein